MQFPIKSYWYISASEEPSTFIYEWNFFMFMLLPDCIFCKIIKGEIPSYKVSEDGQTLAILDINPVNKGHTLVMPKEHHVNILDVPEAVLSATMKTVKKITIALSKYADGVNIGQNTKKAAGQLVDHLHFHVIPRYTNDGLQHWESKGGYGKDEALQVLGKIRNLLKEQ